MYNQIFSPQWIFDRCMEISSLNLWPAIILSTLITISFYTLSNFFINKANKYLKESPALIRIIKIVLFVLFIIPLFFSFLMTILILGLNFENPTFPNTTNNIFIILIALLLSIFTLIFINKSLKWISDKSLSLALKLILIAFTSILSFPIAMIFILYVGYGVVGCRAQTQFWPGIIAAHEIHGKLKENYLATSQLPKTESELEMLDDNTYKNITNNAKTKYIYDPQKNSFTWFVRPSRYFVAVFDTQSDYKLYRLTNREIGWFKESVSQYPPIYDGPWNKLPR